MAYNPPAGGAVNFDFSLPYTPAVATSVNFTFPEFVTPSVKVMTQVKSKPGLAGSTSIAGRITTAVKARARASYDAYISARVRSAVRGRGGIAGVTGLSGKISSAVRITKSSLAGATSLAGKLATAVRGIFIMDTPAIHLFGMISTSVRLLPGARSHFYLGLSKLLTAVRGRTRITPRIFLDARGGVDPDVDTQGNIAGTLDGRVNVLTLTVDGEGDLNSK